MTLRVLLVGMVASLGLALPSGERLESLTRSGRAWVHARLVAWGSNEPVDDEAAFVFVPEAVEVALAPTPQAEPEPAAEPKPEAEAETVAEAQAPAPEAPARVETPVTQAPVVAEAKNPVQVEDFDLEAALEEWTETETVTVTVTAAPAPAPAPPVAGINPDDFDLQAALDEWTETVAPAPAVAEIEVVLPAWLSERLAEWTGQTLVDSRLFVVTAEAIESAPKPAVEPPADPDRAFKAVVEEMAAAFTADNLAAERREVLKVAEQAPTWDLLEVGDELYPGETDDWNRESVGTRTSAPAMAAPPDDIATEALQPPAPKERWTRAIRLTREAVDAWANLLHGPAIVTIER